MSQPAELYIVDGFPVLNLENLKPTGFSPVTTGTEKNVYKMTDGVRNVAAKIHRADSLSENPSLSTLEEYQAYLKLRATPIRRYIPMPYYLIRSMSEIKGLAVEWRDGSELLLSDLRLTRTEVTLLSSSLTGLSSIGIALARDMLLPHNLCIGNTNTPRLYFAECQTKDIKTKKEDLDWLERVEEFGRVLLEEYAD